MTKIDIATEQWRIYTYPNGDTFKISQPMMLWVIADERGTTHRVVDKEGVTHRPERGWVGISWLPAPDAAPFVA